VSLFKYPSLESHLSSIDHVVDLILLCKYDEFSIDQLIVLIRNVLKVGLFIVVGDEVPKDGIFLLYVAKIARFDYHNY
jgi:hypothetical protein